MKTLEVDELKERIDEILRMIKEGKTFQLTYHGEVIARVVPESETKQPTQQDLDAFWARMDKLAAEIGAHWQGDISAVEAVYEVRRDL